MRSHLLLVLLGASMLCHLIGADLRNPFRFPSAQAVSAKAQAPRNGHSRPSRSFFSTSDSYDDATEADFLSANSNGDGFRSEFVMGKDKELFYASIDLGWLYRTIVNKHTWRAAFSRVWQRICRLSINYNRKCLYRESLLQLVASLKTLNPSCNLKFLRCSLKEAQDLAIEKQKFIVYYVEENVANELTPSLETVLFRNALSQTGILSSEGVANEHDFGSMDRGNLVDVLNKQFLVMASDHEHPYAHHVQSLLASYYATLLDDRSHPGITHTAFAMAVSELQFPLLVVVAPAASEYESFAKHAQEERAHRLRVEEIERETRNDPLLRKKTLKKLRAPRYRRRSDLNLEVLGVLRLNPDLVLDSLCDQRSAAGKTYDVSELIVRFLERVLQEHRERLELLSPLEKEEQAKAITSPQQQQQQQQEQQQLLVREVCSEEEAMEESKDESAAQESSDSGSGGGEEEFSPSANNGNNNYLAEDNHHHVSV